MLLTTLWRVGEEGGMPTHLYEASMLQQEIIKNIVQLCEASLSGWTCELSIFPSFAAAPN